MDSTAAPAVAKLAALKKRAFSLGAANALDYAMQFLLPVVLVRFLSPEAFGQYRLLWLGVITVAVALSLQMPQSLYFFLPRSDAVTKRLYVHQTLLYMGVAGLLGGLAISPWNPLLPAGLRSLSEYALIIPSVAVLFTAAALLDMLPTIEERVNWQAGCIIALSLLRSVALALAAWLTGDLRVLIWLLLALFGFKFLLLLAYVAKMHGLASPWFERRSFVKQFSHAAPFGVASALNGLRGQSDQWIVASLFALGNFAAFSIGAVLGPMVTLVRQSVNFVFLPSMSRQQAVGDLAGMVETNSSANVMVATLVYPLIAFAFVFAEDLVTLVYTSAYIAAAPVMRVYALSLVIYVVELSSIMLLMREGTFAVRLNLAVLVVSVAVSWFAAHHFGLAGAAAGSTLALYADRFATLRRIGMATGISLRHLQNWPALGRRLLHSAVAGALAWSIVAGYFAATGAFFRLLVGGATVTATYAALWALTESAGGRLSLASTARIGVDKE